MTSPPQCPPRDHLEQLLSGTLPAVDADPIRSHLGTCVDCQTSVDRLTDSDELSHWLSSGRVPADELSSNDAFHHWMRRLKTEAFDPSSTSGDPRPSSAVSAEIFSHPARPGDIGQLGDYLVEQELGQGGMGIVYRAFDPKLRRLVAIKVLHPGKTDERARSRLVREAQATARFRHDNVVTVHAVVDPIGGLPYLVMEFIAGSTLSEIIRPTPGHRGGIPSRQATEMIAQVADGLAAAHQAGLVHRDIKPENVMIEAGTGRLKLMDFGLARGEGDLGHLTREDMLAGTPGYMSPEQAGGEPSLDARSDVYALGVTFYEMLTGEIPFRGAPQVVLRQVLNEDPRPPRELNDGVPRDLETICLKAMAKAPARRYPSASEMAADLRRFLSGEPIHARPTGPVERLIRRARRNPRITALSVALLGALLIGVSGILWQWSQAERFRTRAETQRDEAVRQRAQARRDFRRAREAVDRYLTQVSDDPELKSENLDLLRRELLKTAREFYENFLADHPDDPELAADLGRAHGRLGAIAMDLESIARGAPHYERKREIFRRLLNQHPNDPDYRHELAQSHLQVGWGVMFEGNFKKAEQQYLKARELWTNLVREQPENEEYAYYLARAFGHLGMLDHYRLNRFDQAELHYGESREILNRLLAKKPSDTKYRAQMAGLLHRMGEVYGLTDRPDLGVATLREAIGLQEALVHESPRNSLARARLGNDLIALGELWDRTGNVDGAAKSWTRAFEHIDQAAREHPAQTLYRAALGEAHDMLGRLAVRDKSSPDDALRHLHAARDIQQELLLANPEESEMVYRLQQTYYDMFLHNLVLGQIDQALAVFDGAQKHFERPHKTSTSEALKHRSILLSIHLMKADALRVLNRPVESLAEYDLARGLAESTPHSGIVLRLRSLSDGLLAVGRRDLVRARSLALEAAKAAPKHGETLYGAAAVVAACAGATDLGRNPSEREQLSAESVNLLRQAHATHYLAPTAMRKLLAASPSFHAIARTKIFERLVNELGEG